MNKTLVVIRDGEVKLTLPRAVIRADGSIWYNNIPLLNCGATGALDKATAAAVVKAGQWDKIPAAMYTHLGVNESGLIVRDAAEIESERRTVNEQARKDYDLANPGASERRAIHALFAHARARRDAADDNNTMDYFRLSSQANARLKIWREKYPAEARAEDAAALRVKADGARSLAAGAMVYDCDGSLSPQMQGQRRVEFLASAADYDKRAAKLSAKK